MDQDLNPKWLLKIKKTGKIPDRIPFEKVLQRALFYPACGIDFMYVNLLTEQLHNINRNTKFNLKESLRNFFSKKGNQYPVISKYIYGFEFLLLEFINRDRRFYCKRYFLC